MGGQERDAGYREPSFLGERMKVPREMGSVRNDDDVQRSDDNLCARVGRIRRGNAMRVGAGGTPHTRRAGAGNPGTPLMQLQQVVSPTRQQLRIWQEMADDAMNDPDVGMSGALEHAEAHAEPHIFQRVGSTGVTSVRQVGDRERERGPAEKDVRLSVGRNGVYSARELRRTSLQRTGLHGDVLAGGLAAGGEGIGLGGVTGMGVGSKSTQDRGRSVQSREQGRLGQLPSARAHDHAHGGARASGDEVGALDPVDGGGHEGTRRGATRGVMVVTDDLDGLPAEIAAARLRRRMLSDVWSGFQVPSSTLSLSRSLSPSCPPTPSLPSLQTDALFTERPMS